jgi:hypothetical protein
MTISEISEFPAIAAAAQVVDPLDAHRQRQVLGFVFERYGWNLQPSGKKIATTASPNNRSEFAAIEEAVEHLDQLTPAQQGQAVALLATRYSCKVSASYKPPAGGFKPKRKFSKG